MTVALLGGGPSLDRQQFDRIDTAHASGKVMVLAINNSYQMAPYAEVCYFADARWWKAHRDKKEFREFSGEKASIQDSANEITDESIHILRNRDYPSHGLGLSLNPRVIVTGRHGGFQALNIAILAGAKRILLLGFDGASIDGKSHWHNDHKWLTHASAYQEYAKSFSYAEKAIKDAGVTVINCSTVSQINSFPKMTLERALEAY
jgi:hypothetical protein